MPAEPVEILERLQRLEQQNRWMRIVLTILALVVGSAALLGQATGGRPVGGQQAVFKDGKGNKRIELNAADGLTIYDDKGEPRIQLGRFEVIPEKNSDGVLLRPDGHDGRFFTLSFLDPKGNNKVCLTLSKQHVIAAGEKGERATPTSLLSVFDETGKTIASLPADGPPHRKGEGGGSGEVIESAIDGDFDGWDGETIFKLQNGQIWQQAELGINVAVGVSPEVVIYKTSKGFVMKVEGEDEEIAVKRIK